MLVHARYDSAGMQMLDPNSPTLLTFQLQTELSSLTFENMGTSAVPNYALRATVLPRTGSIASLSSISSGGGELASATDAWCIVQMNGTSPSGTTAIYTPMAVGVWDDSSSTFVGTEGNGLSIRSGPGDGLNNAIGYDLTLTAESGSSEGGDIILAPGAGTTIGSFYLWKYEGATSTFINASNATGLRFFGTVPSQMSGPTSPPTVTGSRGGNAALASLLTALASYGLIVNSSTA